MKEVAISIALANIGSRVNPEEVYSFIESRPEDFETYGLAPARPGSIRAAAIDYTILLGVVGSVASIASLLWMAYEKFIEPKKDKDDNAGIIVIIRKDNGENEQFWIGNTDKLKDVFIQKFTEKVTSIRQTNAVGESTEQAISELKIESQWVRRK